MKPCTLDCTRLPNYLLPSLYGNTIHKFLTGLHHCITTLVLSPQSCPYKPLLMISSVLSPPNQHTTGTGEPSVPGRRASDTQMPESLILSLHRHQQRWRGRQHPSWHCRRCRPCGGTVLVDDHGQRRLVCRWYGENMTAEGQTSMT